jgi:predicted 3-demethylubiquinone-9 3-methyltransferase (glyoxalase superfamily)
MAKITPFLWFDNNAEEAIEFYSAIFKDAKLLNAHRMPNGALMMGTFQLAGQTFMALNAGPKFKFTEAISLFVSCETQEEVDGYWNQLLEGGGTPQPCGWLKDKFGLSWQIIPTALGQLMGDKDPAKSQRVMQAMMGMTRIDIAGLKKAHAG